jgi:hypothetical protein
MTKLPFTAHWSAQEAQIIFEFLGDLKDVIWSVYEAELIELYQAECTHRPWDNKEQFDLDFDDDKPF